MHYNYYFVIAAISNILTLQVPCAPLFLLNFAKKQFNVTNIHPKLISNSVWHCVYWENPTIS